jgi:hypothetical protein
VLSFSGAPSPDTVERRGAAFRQQVRDEGYTISDESPRYARYDPPWTIPALRRNEIMIEITGP